MTGPILNAVLAACVLLRVDGPADPPEAHDPLSALQGDYACGDGFSFHALTLTPDGRFRSEETGCLGVYDCNAGRAEVVGGRLVLTPDTLNLRRVVLFLELAGESLVQALDSPEVDLATADTNIFDLRRCFNGLWEIACNTPEAIAIFRSGCEPSEFIPVRWGERLYLVPEGDGQAFCNSVNLGREPRLPASGFYLRASADEQPVEGLPDVPAEWRPMLLDSPIQGRVARVLDDGRARVDIGKDRGVWKGMHLESDPGRTGASEVVEVDATSCIIKRFYEGQPPFEIGQIVRSREPGND